MRVAKSTITKKVNRLVDYDDDSEDEAPGQEQSASEQQHQPQQGKGTEAALFGFGVEATMALNVSFCSTSGSCHLSIWRG